MTPADYLKMLPPGSQVALWLVTVGFVIRMLSIDKIAVSAWEEVLKPYLVNRTVTAHQSNLQSVTNTLSLPNAMDSVGYHYYAIGRRLVDIAISLPQHIATREAKVVFFRARISSDMDRSRNLLATKMLDTGLSLDAHLRQFQSQESNVEEFYEPIIEALERGVGTAEIRETILISVDKLYTDAGNYFSKKHAGNGVLLANIKLPEITGK